MVLIPRIFGLLVFVLSWAVQAQPQPENPSALTLAATAPFPKKRLSDLKTQARAQVERVSGQQAQDTQPNPFIDYPSMADLYYPEKEKSYIERSVDYLLSSHASVSSAVKVVGKQMDAYFAGEQFEADENASYVRIRAGNRWVEGGRFEPDFDYKFRVDLPGTKKRYRLVLKYGDDNEKSLESRNRPSEEALPQGEQSFFAGLVKNVISESGRWEGKVSGGVKVRLPPDPFVRLSGKRYFDMGDVWSSHFRTGVEWFNSDGFRWEGDQVFERLVFNDLLFRTQSSLDWREELDKLEFGQTFSLYQAWSEKEAVEYQIGAFGTSLSKARVDTYYISASYRHNLYKDWLYMQVIPELAFLRENEFTGEASTTLSFELFFR